MNTATTLKKVALVTGGARGIGLGIATALAREGCDLALCGMREESAVADTLAALRKFGVDVFYCRADVSISAERTHLLDKIKERFGRLNVLVNNAGVAPQVRADLLDASEESFERVLRTNLQGPYFLTQAAARWMVEQRAKGQSFTGCIINVSSVSAAAASVNRGEYCISKAGVSMATQLWAVRLGEFQIPVYEIRPGIIQTDMTAGVKEKYDRLIAGGLLVESRWGLPEDVGKVAATLVRGDLPYATGQVIAVDGGLSIKRL